MGVKKGLGRSFSSLLPTTLDEEFDPTSQQDEKVSELRQIAIEKVVPNADQPRRHFEEEAMNELIHSIARHGVMQAIVVTPKGDKYEIVAGERRWRASNEAGLKKIPAIVRTLSDQHKLELALIENLQRQDLNAIEEGTAYLKLQQQFNLTLVEIGQRVGGKAESTISNALRLLRLSKEAKEALVNKQISEGHARQLLAIKDQKDQLEFLRLIIKNNWTVRKAEQYVIGYKEGKKDKNTGVAKTQSETKQTRVLGKKLGAKVTIKNMAKGGQLMIRFKSDDDLERISKLLMH